MKILGGTGKLVFTFPGQGSYSAPVLEELYQRFPYNAQFDAADRIARRILGHAFLPLAAGNPAEREQSLKAFPSLDQVAIYVTDVLIADVLTAAGIRPDLLLGHSFGELAALAAGGAYSFEAGVTMVCQRCISLQPLQTAGRMAAVSCGPEKAAALILASGGKTLQIAVINHDRQTVISGNEAELTALGNVAAQQGINVTVLASRYPFHSALLSPAVAPFRAMLCGHTFRQPSIPVYLGTEEKLCTPDCDLADSLSAQFTRKLDFRRITGSLFQAGYSRFVECGAKDALTGILSKALDGRVGLICRASAHPSTGVAAGTAAIIEEFERGVPRRTVDSIGELMHDVQDVLRRTSEVLLAQVPATQPVAEPEPSPAAESPFAEPIAIVGMGCVLPNAPSPDEFWKNICNGVTGIVDSSRDDPSLAHDFLAGRNGTEISIVPDKTYTLLYGSVGTIRYDAQLLSGVIDKERFESFSRAEKLLALSTAQSLASMKTSLAGYADERLRCIIGATGDGCGEYEEALLQQDLNERLTELTPDPALRAKLSGVLNKAWSTTFTGHPGEKYQDVIRTVLGRPIRQYVVDAACSSSLYSIHIGMRALRERTADAVLAGGVFAPGPANSALFAQFRGLAPEACRPLDASADGVVFGHGSGVLILKRLSDAIADGDRIVGVVRSMGISSDGKSPAINVPQSAGQSLAVRRAYETSGVSVDTIQYVEAHATGTPVGDAVEFKALCDSFAGSAGRARIELGSIKSLIGHTGWAAGAASVIKLCKAFENRTVPSQYNFTKTGPEIPLEGSPFTISAAAHAWPENVDGLPRRAAINGFGFGGTNAHLVLEEYSAAYHKKLCAPTPARPAPTAKVAVIDWAALFPSRQQLAEAAPTGERSFDRKRLRLPKGKMLLPDVLDHMDPSQYLAAVAAEQVLSGIKDKWPALRSDIGVVVGVESKTDLGVRINQRIFLDRLRRRALEHAINGARQDLERFLEQLSAAIRKDVLTSGPYTLPGLMPNLVAGRVSQMFDLHGPNIVVDAGADSLFQSVDVAAGFLAHGECKVVLAGGISAARTSPEHCEGAFMMALTTPEIANEYGLPVKCLLSVGQEEGQNGVRASSPGSWNYRGAHGMVELSRALGGNQGQEITLCMGGSPPKAAPADVVMQDVAMKEFDGTWGSTRSPYVYVEGTPISYYTPVMVPAEAAPSANVSLRSRKLLFLTHRTDKWVDLERSGALNGFHFQVLGPMEPEAELTATLDRLSGSFDTIVAVQSLDDASSVLSGSCSALSDLLFTVCRHSYPQIESAQVWVGSLSLNAFRSQSRLDPHTGLAAGFLKSLARELPGASVRILNTDETNLATALRQLEGEFGRPYDGCETCFQGGKRHSIQLAKTDRLSDGGDPGLDAGSVVLATGGGRGVTAVLVEELLNRFGCTVIALGRTDPAAAPAHILAMDEVQLFQYEQQFYKEQIASGGKKITELKKQFQGYQSALEVHETVRRLSALPGRFEYISTDLINGQNVATVVESVFRRYGRVDLVLHGAGTQVSKILPKKTLRDFQGVMSAKLDSLRFIYQACRKHGAAHSNGRPTSYHILTSAFSYMGNDGQEDYGAANETMNRLAAVMDGNTPGEKWTSVAWLGWAGIGMTRGLEYAALAARRGLRGVTKEEGQKIFAELLKGRATAPINVTLSNGEIDFYKVRIAAPPAAPARKNSIVIEREVSADDSPYLWNHLVDGIPTLPGVFLMILIAEAALDLRPDLKIVAFEDAAFRRFVRLRREGKTPLRLHASVVSEDANGTLVRVSIRIDVIHKNGMVLQKDVELTAVSVRLGASVASAPLNGSAAKPAAGDSLEDPYVMGGSPVQLDGPFRSLENITAGRSVRAADYRLREAARSAPGGYRFLNLIMLDALLRFGGIYQESDTVFPIYVPEACRTLKIFYDFTNPDEKTFTGSLRFAGSNPKHMEDDRLSIGPVEASDLGGRMLALVEGGMCRRLGEVRNGG